MKWLDVHGDGRLACGDCLEVMASLEPDSVAAIVTDPPYGLGFMGKAWDHLPPGRPWADQCVRVLKPGGWLVAFGGTRTIHRLTAALEDAGLEIRDTIAQCHWQGFPKSQDAAKALDGHQGVEREVVGQWRPEGTARPSASGGGHGTAHSGEGPQEDRVALGTLLPVTAATSPEARRWEGYGTALKPALELAVLARKPLAGTLAHNLLTWGVGALNIDGTRHPAGSSLWPGPQDGSLNGGAYSPDSGTRGPGFSIARAVGEFRDPGARWPANLIHVPKASTGEREAGTEGLRRVDPTEVTGRAVGSVGQDNPRAGLRGRPRGNHHPTPKPVDLMRWLVRLVMPPDPEAVVLDPFAGSGSTLIGAHLEGVRWMGVEREPDYCEIVQARLAHHTAQGRLAL